MEKRCPSKFRLLSYAMSLSVILPVVSSCWHAPNAKKQSIEKDVTHLIQPVARSENGSKVYLRLAKKSLGSEFLLRTNVVQGGAAPEFYGKRTRIVTFQRRDGRLLMLEADQGLKYYTEIPQDYIVEDFPIVSESDDFITFDFNSGMNRILAARSWHAHDDKANDKFNEVVHSLGQGLANQHIKRAELRKGGGTFIEQGGNLHVQEQNYSAKVGVSVHYLFEPYSENKSFKPTLAPSTDRYAFFEVAPLIDKTTGSPKNFATKFDISKPIVFHLSANTPKEFVETIKEGILYWNSVLGPDVIRVEIAPKGISAPSYDYNMVQWVDHPTSGIARADAQVDPRTGEILNAQIYLASVFAESGSIKVEGLLRAGAEGQVQADHLCDHQFVAKTESEFAKLLRSEGATNEKVLSFVQDYLRQTVAHEVGHTLGLRHNFLGIMGGNIRGEDKVKIHKDMYKTGSVPDGVLATSTVMDYLGFSDDVITGRQIKTGQFVGEYDKKAIEQLYGLQEHASGSFPFFCTDGHLGKFVDCAHWRYAQTPFEEAKSLVQKNLRAAADILYERMLSAVKSPHPGKGVQEVSRFRLEPDSFAMALLESARTAFKAVRRDAQLITLRQAEKGPLGETEYKEKRTRWIKNELAQLGGWEGIFPSIPGDIGETTRERFQRLMNDAGHLKGMTLAGDEYQFTPEDLAFLNQEAEKIFAGMYKALVKAQLKILSEEVEHIADDRVSSAEESDVSEELAAYLSRIARPVLTTFKDAKDFPEVAVILPKKADKTAKPKSGVETEAVVVALPAYFFDLETRVLAASLFKASRNEVGNFAAKERADFDKELKAGMNAPFNDRDILEFPSSTLAKNSRVFRRWYEEEKKVLNAWATPVMIFVGR